MGVSATTERPEQRARRFISIVAVVAILLIIAVFAVLLFGQAPANMPSAGYEAFGSGWEYRWGTSAEDITAVSKAGWAPIDHPSNPPERDGRRYAWFRARLPEIPYLDPVLFIYSIDTAAEAYIGDERIYSQGNFAEESPPFLGWPWHTIPLEPDHADGYLTFRVYSDYFDIGLWGEILIGSRGALIKKMVMRDMPRVGVGLFSLFLAGAFLILYFIGNRVSSNVYFALSILPIGIRVLAYTHIQQFYLSSPLLCEYIRAGSYFLIPVGFTLVISGIVGKRYALVTGLIWKLSIAYFVAAIGLSLMGVISIHSTYLIFDYFYVAAIATLSTLAVVSAFKENVEARFLAVNFAVMAVLSIYSVLISNSVLPWVDEINYIIMFVFSLGLGHILARRFRVLYSNLEKTTSDLERMAQNLEAKVQERTLQLKDANRALEKERDSLHIDSITDSLTTLHNRRYIEAQLKRMISEANRYGRKLTVMLLDLDRFKMLNDSFGHVMGDEVLRSVGEIMIANLRESDIAGRFGGEEFLVILPETEVDEAFSVADRIREMIRNKRWENPDVNVTISGGIASYTSGDIKELLEQADLLLYAAKSRGRDQIACSERNEP